MTQDFDEKNLRDYLLGNLSEARQAALEDAVFNDADLRSRLETAENDLIDEYARHELTGAERRQFEIMFFNSAERIEKIEFAAAFNELPKQKLIEPTIGAPIENKSFWNSVRKFFRTPQLAVAAVLLLILGFGTLFLLTRRPNEPQIAKENNQNINAEIPENTANGNSNQTSSASNIPDAPANVDKSNAVKNNNTKIDNKNAVSPAPAPVPDKTPIQTAPTFATLIFPSGLLRDGGNQKFSLDLSGKETRARLIFNLEKGDDLPFYIIKLHTRDGKMITSSKVPRRSRQISLNLPATNLSAGFYTATVSGLAADGTSENLGFFDFEVIKP